MGLNNITLLRVWTLVNEDTLEVMKGQYEAEAVTENVGAAYAERFSLNRQNAITQFLHGETRTVSFRGRFYNETVTGGAFPFIHPGRQDELLTKLKSWVKRDDKTSRPPIMTFWVGDGHLQMRCIIESISGIVYDQPQALGLFHGATFTVSLRKYAPYDIEAKSLFDTRYHVAAEADYYEMLAWREYKNASLGVWLRQQNPTQPNLNITNIVKLPAPGGPSIRTAKVKQTSVIFKTAYGREMTDQRTRRLDMLAKRNKARVSHVIQAGSGLGG